MTSIIVLTPNTTTDKCNETLMLSNAFENEFSRFVPIIVTMVKKCSNLISRYKYKTK